MTKKTKTSKIDINFEKAMERLEDIVNELDEGSLSLDKSLDDFEEGMKLAKSCEDILNKASGRVDKIMKNFSGKEKIVALSDEEMEDDE